MNIVPQLTFSTSYFTYNWPTWFQEVHYLVENSNCDQSDEGKVPVDDKHDGHTNGSSKQCHPSIV